MSARAIGRDRTTSVRIQRLKAAATTRRRISHVAGPNQPGTKVAGLSRREYIRPRPAPGYDRETDHEVFLGPGLHRLCGRRRLSGRPDGAGAEPRDATPAR